jgi:hypothetical protein
MSTRSDAVKSGMCLCLSFPNLFQFCSVPFCPAILQSIIGGEEYSRYCVIIPC